MTDPGVAQLLDLERDYPNPIINTLRRYLVEAYRRITAIEKAGAELLRRLDLAEARVKRGAEIVATTPRVSFGARTITGTLAVGATANIDVPLLEPMPGDQYVAVPVLSDPGPLLGILTVDGVMATTTTQVTVRVRNTGLAILSQKSLTIYVLAMAPA